MTRARTKATLEAELEAIREKHQLPALAVSVVQDGETVEIAAVGRRRNDSPVPVSQSDLWHLGSCTKAMTATLIATLVEEGALGWGTTIAESLPDLLPDLDPAWRSVSVEQLLSHRSGLPEDRQPDAVIFPKIREIKGPMREQRRQLVRLVMGQAPAQPPETGMVYSNYGYSVAGAMAEAAARDTWENLLRARVFEPLGMNSAGYGPPGTPGDLSQPRGHEDGKPVEPGIEADNPAVCGPSNSVHCHLGDLGRFAALHLAGAQGKSGFLRPETFADLHRSRSPEGYALGWAVGEQDTPVGPTVSHAGSNGLWTAITWLSPPKNVACLVAANAGVDRALEACQAALRFFVSPYIGEA